MDKERVKAEDGDSWKLRSEGGVRHGNRAQSFTSQKKHGKRR